MLLVDLKFQTREIVYLGKIPKRFLILSRIFYDTKFSRALFAHVFVFVCTFSFQRFSLDFKFCKREALCIRKTSSGDGALEETNPTHPPTTHPFSSHQRLSHPTIHIPMDVSCFLLMQSYAQTFRCILCFCVHHGIRRHVWSKHLFEPRSRVRPNLWWSRFLQAMWRVADSSFADRSGAAHWRRVVRGLSDSILVFLILRELQGNVSLIAHWWHMKKIGRGSLMLEMAWWAKFLKPKISWIASFVWFEKIVWSAHRYDVALVRYLFVSWKVSALLVLDCNTTVIGIGFSILWRGFKQRQKIQTSPNTVILGIVIVRCKDLHFETNHSIALTL